MTSESSSAFAFTGGMVCARLGSAQKQRRNAIASGRKNRLMVSLRQRIMVPSLRCGEGPILCLG